MKKIVRIILVLLLVSSIFTSCSENNSTTNTNDAKAITSFSFTNPAASATIDENAKTVSITVPHNTDVTALTATYTTTGAKVQVGSVAQASGTTPIDFTNPVSYVVTAADGSTATYTVTVTVASDSAKAITAFSITNPAVSGTINEETKTILITVPYKTNVTALFASFITTGASVQVGSTVQVSGTTTNDFTNAVLYVVSAADGSTATYTVTVAEASDSAKAITEFSFTNPIVSGVVNEEAKTISVTVPYKTNVTALYAKFTTTGIRVQVGSIVQESRRAYNDFTNPVLYVVTAADGTKATYTVTVTVGLNPAKVITVFSFANPAVTGIINESSKTISLTVPGGTDLTSLIASFATTGVSVKVGSTVQVSGTTPNNFTTPVIYTVTAENGSTANYAVTVTLAFQPNYVSLQSDSGDFIGQGKKYYYTQANSIIKISASSGRLSVSVTGDEDWRGDFRVPNSLSQLQTGYYGNFEGYPFHDPALGGLEWWGDGRGCNRLSGWFSIDNVTYSNGNLTAIDLRFEQNCECGSTTLHGRIHWSSSDTTSPPGPINPPPAGLWQPLSGSTPSSGNYIYLISDAGDYIGQGQTYTYTPANATITVSATGNHLTTSISVNGNWWWGDFQTMSFLSQLLLGYYGNLQRSPFHNPTRGGLSWDGFGRGCNTLTGWFVVDNVTYSSGALTAIDLRFEQHCEGGTTALRGQIHWVK